MLLNTLNHIYQNWINNNWWMLHTRDEENWHKNPHGTSRAGPDSASTHGIFVNTSSALWFTPRWFLRKSRDRARRFSEHTYVHTMFCHPRGALYKISLYGSLGGITSPLSQKYSPLSLCPFTILTPTSPVSDLTDASQLLEIILPPTRMWDLEGSRFILTVMSLFLLTDSGLTPALLPVASGSSLSWPPLHRFIHQPVWVFSCLRLSVLLHWIELYWRERNQWCCQSVYLSGWTNEKQKPPKMKSQKYWIMRMNTKKEIKRKTDEADVMLLTAWTNNRHLTKDGWIDKVFSLTRCL